MAAMSATLSAFREFCGRQNAAPTKNGRFTNRPYTLSQVGEGKFRSMLMPVHPVRMAVFDFLLGGRSHIEDGALKQHPLSGQFVVAVEHRKVKPSLRDRAKIAQNVLARYFGGES